MKQALIIVVAVLLCVGGYMMITGQVTAPDTSEEIGGDK